MEEERDIDDEEVAAKKSSNLLFGNVLDWRKWNGGKSRGLCGLRKGTKTLKFLSLM